MGDTLQHLEDQRRYHERLIEVSPTSVVTADADFTVTSWNPAAEMVSELPEPEQLVAIEAMGRVRSPYTSEALEAIAWTSLPPKVRKAARTALHRARSRGG